MQQKSIDNVTMESKAYNLIKEIKESSTLFNSDHIYCNPLQLLENENNKKETINNLKSMVILNLELIKEQADQLLSKDKQIAKLKQENEELKSKLDKYEQRRNQAKRFSNKDSNSSGNKRKIKAGSSQSTEDLKIPDSKSINSNAATHGCPNRLITGIEMVQPVNGTPIRRRFHRKLVVEEIAPKNRQTNSTLDPYEFISDEPKPKQMKQDTNNSRVKPFKETEPKKSAFMTTKSEYLICDWRKSAAELDAEAEPQMRASLEIPSWIVKETQSCYQIEGTEDMSDPIFEKRHLKYETDERRRKKWDVQRLREHKMVERLKKRYLKDEQEGKQRNKSEVNAGITSFYPSIDNIKYIQIVDELPIIAFGEPIPCLKETDFTLPWHTNPDLSNMSPSTSFTKTRFFKNK